VMGECLRVHERTRRDEDEQDKKDVTHLRYADDPP
jgi:hypothetical protein